MAIHTRLGNEVESVEWYDEDEGQVRVIVKHPGGVRTCVEGHVLELVADGGIHEIIKAAKEVRFPSYRTWALRNP
jgi:hypothetical protein